MTTTIFNSDSDHQDFLDSMLNRIRFSEDKLSSHRDRWENAYKACTAYIVRDMTTERRARLVDEYIKTFAEGERNNEDFYAAMPVELVIPYTYAVVHTCCTMLLSQFTAQRPFFPVSTQSTDDVMVQNGKNLEALLQYQLDYCNYRSELHKAIQSTAITGTGVLQVGWEEIKKRRRRAEQTMIGDIPRVVRVVDDVIVYSGNKVRNIDPFYFLPDPRVPMHRLHTDGEYAFWVDYVPIFKLKMDTQYVDVDLVEPAKRGVGDYAFSNDRFGLEHVANNASDASQSVYSTNQDAFKDGQFVKITEGTIVLSNADVAKYVKRSYMRKYWDESTITNVGYQKFLVTICNEDTIIQLIPFDYDHGNHPVTVMEPTMIGLTFGSMSVVDMVMDFEKIISWLFNSRVNNVQQILNTKVFYNADAVNGVDLSDPSRIFVPISSSIYNVTAQQTVHSFVRPDVTETNMSQIQQVIRLAELIVGLGPTLMGQPMPSGRRTAAESRMTAQSGYNRIGHLGIVAASQGLQPLAVMLSDNIQQFLDAPQVVDGSVIQPNDVLGAFEMSVLDATQPVDPTMLIQTWGELLQLALKDPQLRQSVDIVGLYSTLGTLSGLRGFSKHVKQTPIGVPTPGATQNVQPGAGQPTARQNPPSRGVPRGTAVQ